MATAALPLARGVVGGLGASLALTRLLQQYLFETAPTDPVTFALVALVVVTAGALAALVPGWRAMRIDPTALLRSE
jgi:predicted lysophospholipase L1 biosynthesis ABC-type transport system permease subunit